MQWLLDSLNQYANLLLAVITAVYVVLTWRMASEMQKAREAQADSNVVAFPYSYGQVYAGVQLHNVGPGVALRIELSISLSPGDSASTRFFREAVLAANQTEEFLLTAKDMGSLESLSELTESHQDLILAVQWDNIYGHHKAWSETYNLKSLADGWYRAHHLIKPDDVPHAMRDMLETFKKMERELQDVATNVANRRSRS